MSAYEVTKPVCVSVCVCVCTVYWKMCVHDNPMRQSPPAYPNTGSPVTCMVQWFTRRIIHLMKTLHLAAKVKEESPWVIAEHSEAWYCVLSSCLYIFTYSPLIVCVYTSQGPPRVNRHTWSQSLLHSTIEQDQCKYPAWPPPLIILIVDGATEKASKQVRQHPAWPTSLSSLPLAVCTNWTPLLWGSGL